MGLSFVSCLLVMNKLFFFCELRALLWFKILVLMDSSAKAFSPRAALQTPSARPARPTQPFTAA